MQVTEIARMLIHTGGRVECERSSEKSRTKRKSAALPGATKRDCILRCWRIWKTVSRPVAADVASAGFTGVHQLSRSRPAEFMPRLPAVLFGSGRPAREAYTMPSHSTQRTKGNHRRLIYPGHPGTIGSALSELAPEKTPGSNDFITRRILCRHYRQSTKFHSRTFSS